DPGSSPLFGLQLYGGAGLPVPGVNVEPVTHNSISFHSLNDRIEGFVNAIVARGSSRPLASPAQISFNSASIELHGTTLKSIRSDLNLAGAASLVPGTWSDAGNVLRVLARGVTGSGARTNFYGDVVGPAATTFGDGNRLEIIGSLHAFTYSNPGIMPLPPAEFFSGSQQ
nr:hypothetical protein [Gemmatimonadota bacterium]